MKLIYYALIAVTFFSCNFTNEESTVPPIPLLYYSFNGEIKNSGIEAFDVLSTQYFSYAEGINDSCLDLSITSTHRKPVIIKTKEQLHLNSYNGFSTVVWVKQNSNSFEDYTIIGNKNSNTENEKGWLISTSKTGSWSFKISDGVHQYAYNATPIRQQINDGSWHQIAFAVNKVKKEIRLYFDGENVGIISSPLLFDLSGDNNIHIGCAPNSKNYEHSSFYGLIDEIGIWHNALSSNQIKDLFNQFNKNTTERKNQSLKKEFKLLTWNIWNGGIQKGKEVGLDKITSIIKNSNADFITLQEANNAGTYIADKLNYYYYKRSNNIEILSRYPINQTFNLYKSQHLGVCQVALPNNNFVNIASVYLNKKPNIRGLLMNQHSNIDTIITNENKTRGTEAKFILNELRQLENKSQDNDAFILAGDFNSGSHLDWSSENMDNKNGLVIPFPATSISEKMGYTDAFREIYPNEIAEPGITFSPIFNEGYRDRIDYVFYKGNSIQPINAKVIDESSSFFPSNHAAVLITFEIKE